MLPDRISNPGLLIYASGALPIALRGPAHLAGTFITAFSNSFLNRVENPFPAYLGKIKEIFSFILKKRILCVRIRIPSTRRF